MLFLLLLKEFFVYCICFECLSISLSLWHHIKNVYTLILAVRYRHGVLTGFLRVMTRAYGSRMIPSNNNHTVTYGASAGDMDMC